MDKNDLLLGSLLEAMLPVVKRAGAFIKDNMGVSEDAIEVKELNSLVSYVDKGAENILVEGLGSLLPEAGFLTEEETEDDWKGKPYYWIIDPLDGTTNFLHGIPFFAVSVALFDADGEGLLGIVYEVNREEMFTASSGGGAFLNGERIRVSEVSLDRSLLATGFPYSNFQQEEDFYGLFRRLTHESHGIRRIGAAALDLAYVAAGRFDGFFEYNLHLWDIAAGAVLVREAGGTVTDLAGMPNWVSGWSILAANPRVHERILAIHNRA